MTNRKVKAYSKFLSLLIAVYATLNSIETVMQGAPTSASVTPQVQAVKGPWLQVDIGLIGPASEDILRTALDQVDDEKNQGLIIHLDTPGGALETTRVMVKEIMAANFPIIVWVGPAGARAGSAGAFITLAGHIAAMAPGTNIGAAHPVGAGGQDIPEGEIQKKIMNDTVAFMESIAGSRGRNIAVARSFVEKSVSITATKALSEKVIDVIARDVTSLLTQIDGRQIKLANGNALQLSSLDSTITTFEKSLRQRLLEILSNPNLFYLFFLGGLIGLGYELTHPGVIFPGVVGGICLLLALIATSVLPISFGAGALILAGVCMLVAEAFVPSFGTLGIGGFIAFVLGSVFLVDPSNEYGMRISYLTIAPGALAIAVAFLGLGYLIVRSERSPVHAGREAMIGSEAIAIDDFTEGQGQVRSDGAIWQASLVSTRPIDSDPFYSEYQVRKNDKLVVVGLTGLTLHCSPKRSAPVYK